MNNDNCLGNYSFIDYKEKIVFPYPSINAGLYSDPDTFDNKPWGNNYIKKSIPNATDFCKNFYAKHHIPSYNRPGNNSVDSDIYKYYNSDIYNFKCSTFKPEISELKYNDPYNYNNNYKEY